jgi:hypothetical protein
MKPLQQIENELDNVQDLEPVNLQEYVLLFWGVIKAALTLAMLFTNKEKDAKIRKFIFTVENMKEDLKVK